MIPLHYMRCVLECMPPIMLFWVLAGMVPQATWVANALPCSDGFCYRVKSSQQGYGLWSVAPRTW
jgi:hypothetical protein